MTTFMVGYTEICHYCGETVWFWQKKVEVEPGTTVYAHRRCDTVAKALLEGIDVITETNRKLCIANRDLTATVQDLSSELAAITAKDLRNAKQVAADKKRKKSKR